MWFFFKDALQSQLDTSSVKYLMESRSYLVRMHYYFTLMSIYSYFPKCAKYIVAVNNEEYFFRNIHHIHNLNSEFDYERQGNMVYISPLPVIFKLGIFPDRNTYVIPPILGGWQMAIESFALNDTHEEEEN